MARDRDLLGRMYGQPPTKAPDSRRVSIESPVLPLVWILALVGLGVAAVAVALGTLGIGLIAGGGPLEEWGIIGSEDLTLVVHDHSAAGDGSAGCVVTQDRLVRWEDRRFAGAVALPGAEVTWDDAGVHAVNDGHVDCPYAPGDDPRPLWAAARRLAGP
jgi:hypothetical protein